MKLACVALAGLLGLGCAAFLYAASGPPSDVPYSQFSVVGPNGTAASLPSVLQKSQPSFVVIGLTNHEQVFIDYSIQILLMGLRPQINSTTGFNSTIVTNITAFGWFNVSLADGQNSSRRFDFRVDFAGLWKVEFLLFKDPDFSSTYRELHLFVQVT